MRDLPGGQPLRANGKNTLTFLTRRKFVSPPITETEGAGYWLLTS